MKTIISQPPADAARGGRLHPGAAVPGVAGHPARGAGPGGARRAGRASWPSPPTTAASTAPTCIPIRRQLTAARTLFTGPQHRARPAGAAGGGHATPCCRRCCARRPRVLTDRLVAQDERAARAGHPVLHRPPHRRSPGQLRPQRRQRRRRQDAAGAATSPPSIRCWPGRPASTGISAASRSGRWSPATARWPVLELVEPDRPQRHHPGGAARARARWRCSTGSSSRRQRAGHAAAQADRRPGDRELPPACATATAGCRPPTASGWTIT